MNNFHRQLNDSLATSAAHLEVPAGDLAKVLARARTRRRRQGVTAAATVAVLAAVLTASALARLGHHGDVTVAAGGGTAAAGSALKQGDIGVVWQRVDPHSALGATTAIASGGALYALSTAPGVADPSAGSPYPGRQLYRSSDGVEWAQAAGPANAYISELSATSGQLYAVGTGPATVAATGALSPLIVASSGDNGTTWHQVQLPVDVGAIQAGTLSNHSEITKVTSNAKGVVVVDAVGGDLNVAKFLPPGVTAPHGWAITAYGVDLLGPINNPACPSGMSATPPGVKGAVTTLAPRQDTTPGPVGPTACWSTRDATIPAPPVTMLAPQATHPVVRSFTWAQLGVNGDLEQAAKGQPFVFFSPDGKTFRPVSLPNLPTQTTGLQVSSDGDTFAIAANSSPSPAGAAKELLWQSNDGVTWTPAPVPPTDQVGSSAIGYLAGRLTLVSGYGPTSPTVATLGSGGWSEAPLSAILGATPPGARVEVFGAAIGPFGIAVVAAVPPTSPVAPPATFLPGGPTIAGSQTKLSLLVSRDAVTWSNESLDRLAGATVTEVPNLVVTDNRIVVTAQLHNPNTTAAAPETVLVGTAR